MGESVYTITTMARGTKEEHTEHKEEEAERGGKEDKLTAVHAVDLAATTKQKRVRKA